MCGAALRYKVVNGNGVDLLGIVTTNKHTQIEAQMMMVIMIKKNFII